MTEPTWIAWVRGLQQHWTWVVVVDGAFDFTDTGTSYHGNTLELVPSADGNLSSAEVSDADFSLLEPAEASSSPGP